MCPVTCVLLLYLSLSIIHVYTCTYYHYFHYTVTNNRTVPHLTVTNNRTHWADLTSLDDERSLVSVATTGGCEGEEGVRGVRDLLEVLSLDMSTLPTVMDLCSCTSSDGFLKDKGNLCFNQ